MAARPVIALPVCLSLVAAGVLSACGSEDPSTGADGAAGTGELEVVAADISFDQDNYRAEAGSIEVVYRNDGSINHTLVIEDVDGFALEVNANGDVDEGAVALDPGTYVLYCDVAGHREAGMQATLEVS